MKQTLNTFLKQFVNDNRLKVIEEKLLHRTKYITVVLENLHQSHNASAILRTCECLGIQDIHVIENTNSFLPNEEISLGSSKWLTLNNYTTEGSNTIIAAINKLKSKGYVIAATALHKKSTPIEEYPIEKMPTAFVFGTELTGVSDDIINLADTFVSVPMVGFTESLNVSVAAGIVLNQVLTRLKKSSQQWQLTAEEIEELELKWLRNSIKHVKMLEKHYFQMAGQ